jgi:putative lipoprotein
VAAICVVAAAPARADEDPWTGTDKTLHFGVSAGIAAGSYTVGALLFDARRDALIFGGAIAITAGAAKELADLAGAGTPSWKDFTWDVMGTFTGLAVAWGIDLLVRGVSERRPLFVAPVRDAAGAKLVFSF